MINANELRIGNVVAVPPLNRKGVVTSFTQRNVKLKLKGSRVSITSNKGFVGLDINGVPLTEQILIDNGFDHFGDELAIKLGHRFFLTYDKKGGGVFTENTDPDEDTAVLHEHIKYLHQLQNLFQSLTGRELVYSI